MVLIVPMLKFTWDSGRMKMLGICNPASRTATFIYYDLSLEDERSS